MKTPSLFEGLNVLLLIDLLHVTVKDYIYRLPVWLAIKTRALHEMFHVYYCICDLTLTREHQLTASLSSDCGAVYLSDHRIKLLQLFICVNYKHSLRLLNSDLMNKQGAIRGTFHSPVFPRYKNKHFKTQFCEVISLLFVFEMYSCLDTFN